MTHDPRLGLPSGSEMYRVAQCSGSRALIKLLRDAGKLDEKPSADALSGSRVHERLAGNFGIGQLLTAKEFETVCKCIELRDKLIDEWRGDEPLDRLMQLTEQRFYYRRGIKPLFSAQLDLAVLDLRNARALIIDYKSGRTESVAAADNLQLRTEVVCLKAEYDSLQVIDAAIVEPWVDWEPVRVSYVGGQLAAAAADIVAIVDAPPSLHAGAWCTYCPAQTQCPAALAYIDSLPKTTRSDVVTYFELPRGDDGVVFWQKLKVAKKIIDNLERAYEAILSAEPNALPGYILPAHGRIRRVVSDPAKLKAALREYLTDAEIDGCATYHLDKLAEVLGLKHHLAGAELDEKFKNLVNDVLARVYDRPFIRPIRRYEREKLLQKSREESE